MNTNAKKTNETAKTTQPAPKAPTAGVKIKSKIKAGFRKAR